MPSRPGWNCRTWTRSTRPSPGTRSCAEGAEMRFRHPDGQLVHLGYCTNVHPAEDLPGIVEQLDTYALAVRAHLQDEPVGLGLWLAAPVAAALAVDRTACRKLRRELAVRDLEVVTLNGFP